MPTIHRERGFRFLVWPNDHPPPHVHAHYGDEKAVIDIGTGEVPPSIRDPRTMRPPNLRRALDIVRRHQDLMLRGWEKYHDE